jgi:glycosyltransferase involved in cell wall biosynthesis
MTTRPSGKELMTEKPQVLPPFAFQHYINPIWYFNLIPLRGDRVGTAHPVGIDANDESLITEDATYKTAEARKRDKGLQAWNKGLLPMADLATLQSKVPETPKTLVDNYAYIRKYYRKAWVLYILVRRLFNLRNPFAEINAFLKSRSMKPASDAFKPVRTYEDYKSFASPLLMSTPLISVIIPTLNRYEYLRDVLLDLQNQDYKNFEVIIVDQTNNPNKEFYKEFNLRTTLIFQKGKGQWLSRNEAARNCKGNYLLFFDDDSRIEPDWITQHLKALDYFKADISAGVSISKIGDVVPQNYSYFRWADQFDSGNALVKREVFETVGLFDRQFDKMRMGDGEFGLRAYLHGFHSISNPYAQRLHLKVGSGGLRDLGSWDAFKPKSIFSPNPIPSVVYLFRKYFPPAYVRSGLIIGLLPFLIPYRLKHKKSLYPIAIFAGIFLLPLLLIRLNISWRIATKMLREGDKIDWL